MIPTTTLTLLAAASHGLFLATPAAAAHSCSHYVVVTCQNWEDLGYSSADECFEWERMNCARAAAGRVGNSALAAGDMKPPRRAVATAPAESSSTGAPRAPVPSLPLGAK